MAFYDRPLQWLRKRADAAKRAERQRAHAQALIHDSDVDRLTESVRALRSDISQQLSFATYDLAEDLKARAATLQDSLTARLDQLDARLARIELSQQAEDLKARAATLQDSLTARLDQLDARLARIELSQQNEEGAPASQIAAIGAALTNARAETENRLLHIESSIQSRLNDVFGQQFENANVAVAHANSLSGQLRETESRFVELLSAVTTLGGGLQSRFNEIQNAQFENANAATAALNFQQGKLGEVLAKFVEAANSFATIQNGLESLSVETRNRTAHALMTIQSRLNEFQTIASESSNKIIGLDTSLHSRLNELLNERIPAILEQIHAAAALEIAAAGHGAPVQSPQTSRPAPTNLQSFDALLAAAKRDFPTVYSAWKERLDRVSDEFDKTKEGNAAHGGDIYSFLFRSFVARYVRGAVLDIGCGPFGKPYYLQDYPAELISGLEPLPMRQTDGMDCVRGISEYLPWEDASFSTIISATSLDHAISLEKSMAELHRVLRPDGVALLWIGSSPGSPPFLPLDPDFQPADQFHLFHFDTAWFEPILEQGFEFVDRVKLDRASYSHVFYCLKSKVSAERHSTKPKRTRTGAN